MPYSTLRTSKSKAIESYLLEEVMIGGTRMLYLWSDGRGQLCQYQQKIHISSYLRLWRLRCESWEYSIQGNSPLNKTHQASVFSLTPPVNRIRPSSLGAIACPCQKSITSGEELDQSHSHLSNLPGTHLHTCYHNSQNARVSQLAAATFL